MNVLLDGPPIRIAEEVSPRYRINIEIDIRVLQNASNYLWDIQFGSEQNKRQITQQSLELSERIEQKRQRMYELAEERKISSAQEASELFDEIVYKGD